MDCVSSQNHSVLINFNACIRVLKSPNSLRSGLVLYTEDKDKYVGTETFQSETWVGKGPSKSCSCKELLILAWNDHLGAPPSKSSECAVNKCFSKGKD